MRPTRSAALPALREDRANRAWGLNIVSAAVAVEAKNVSKIFGAGVGEVRALDNVSVTIRQNEFFTLLGPSGCGKTTLLRLIAGFEMPTEGSILLDGEEVAHLPPFKRHVNTVFQNYALFPHMTVAQNVAFGLEMLGKGKAEVQQTVAAMLKLVRMEELKDRRTSQISGGQQQRVALARALAPRPKVLLLDEPLSALDLKLRKEMQIELKRMQLETGITFIFVTHDQEEALTMSDRIAVMSKGNILQVGSPTEIYEHPADRFVADFIGETNFIEAEVTERIGDDGRIKLPSGIQVPHKVTTSAGVGSRVTLAIRPERIDLVKADADAHFTGKVSNIVYFGTDTTFHIDLESGQGVTVRMQNRLGHRDVLQVGDVVGLRVEPEAMQVLRD
ncbi:spermidine/putrescine transport system ATP-binding protein [Dongia mobilis]|uniref:Spermidine/putrescine import ATP-binding protein PotA n=1 Tax=Dongia mobilis TaxID=578943 RepID=A0A4R6WIS6_9PROT|nr:spermidine/putrescine transport system ATP-binding protein [Dongia mobilis]